MWPRKGERKMPMFRKKPVTIEAVQYGPYSAPTVEMIQFLERADREVSIDQDGIHIHTLEGKMTASLGDWIIRGVQGEYYPCKPDIFAATYEPAEATP
jgi:hypothetical protein